MKRSVVYLFALGAAASCVLPSVEIDASLGVGNQAAASGATGDVGNGGSMSSPSGGKNGSSSGGNSSGQGATGAEGGDDSVSGGGGVSNSGGGGVSNSGGLGGVGGAGTAGSVGASGEGGGGGGSTKNPPEKSTGCDQATSVTSGQRTITIEGQERAYTIDIPSDYDSSKPYRLFYASHWINSSDEAVVDEGFYYLKPKAAAEPAIFVAPQALPGMPGGTWSINNEVDHLLFENILTFVQENLCIDESRVFAIGFSFGGMMTHSLARSQQSKLRAAVGIAPTNFNIYLPPATGEPIAWMQTTGMQDGTNAWIASGSNRGAKFVAIEHATNNGCTIPAEIPIWEDEEDGPYLCYDFEGCDAGYPTKVCTFNGGHVSAGSSSSATSWITDEVWNFFMQF